MLKITLLKTLYYEMNASIIPKENIIHGKDRRFHTIQKTYDVCPEIKSVTVEERYLPYSILYYLWVNDEKIASDLNEPSVCHWILSFFQEFHPEYLYEGICIQETNNLDQLLTCFNVDTIPSYRDNRAYKDLEITRMEDVKNGTVKEDNRQATFPGMTFSKKYKKDNP